MLDTKHAPIQNWECYAELENTENVFAYLKLKRQVKKQLIIMLKHIHGKITHTKKKPGELTREDVAILSPRK